MMNMGNSKRANKGKSLLSIESEYVCIDLETTGLSPEFDSIIEISAVKVVRGEIVDKYTSLINPKCHISKFISQLTGITDDLVKDAPTIDEVLPEYLNFIGNSIIIGHNVNFDVNFIYDKSERITKKYFSNNFIDTMRLSKLLIKSLEHYRLKDIADVLNVEYTNAHRSLSDCLITISCYEKLKELALEHTELLSNDKKSIISKFKASNVKSSMTEFDELNPFYNKVCVFTGTLSKMPRKEAMQIIVDMGGINKDNVTQDTNFLILGNDKYIDPNNKSAKLRKAEEYKLNGYDIQIISEQVFYDMLDDDYSSNQEAIQNGNSLSEFVPRSSLEEYLKQSIYNICTAQNVTPNIVSINVNNNSSLSVWLCNAREYWDMAGKPNQRVFTIFQKTSENKSVYEVSLLNGRLHFSNFVPLPQQTIIKNDTVYFECDTEYLRQYLLDVFSWELKNYCPPYSFGCCSKYKECSNQRKCVHINTMYAKGCQYRKNLEKNRIFYNESISE